MTGQATPGSDGPGSSGPGPRKKGIDISIWQLIAIGLAAFVIAAIVGYLVGDDEGESAGNQQGQAEVAERFQPGNAGYQRIYAEGRKAGLAAGRKQGEAAGRKQGEAEGKKVGFEEGKTAGVKTGEAEGVTRGANAALGGMGDWQSGSFYVVQVGEGNGIPTAVTQRHLMSQEFEYELCDDDPASLCRVRKPER